MDSACSPSPPLGLFHLSPTILPYPFPQQFLANSFTFFLSTFLSSFFILPDLVSTSSSHSFIIFPISYFLFSSIPFHPSSHLSRFPSYSYLSPFQLSLLHNPFFSPSCILPNSFSFFSYPFPIPFSSLCIYTCTPSHPQCIFPSIPSPSVVPLVMQLLTSPFALLYEGPRMARFHFLPCDSKMHNW